jgi:hypothetical protein
MKIEMFKPANGLVISYNYLWAQRVRSSPGIQSARGGSQARAFVVERLFANGLFSPLMTAVVVVLWGGPFGGREGAF